MKYKRILSLLMIFALGFALTSCHKHEFKVIDCFTPLTCECGETEGEVAAGHDYVDAACLEPCHCTRCGDVLGDILGHDATPATCVDAPVCNRCGETVGEALGHEYEEGDKCVRCGEANPNPPVMLGTLTPTSAEGYAYESAEFTDALGNKWEESLHFSGYTSSAEYTLAGELGGYSLLKGTIVAGPEMKLGYGVDVEIYVDGELVYTLEDYDQNSGTKDFKVEFENASTIKIVVARKFYSKNDIRIVDARLIY